MAEGEHPARCGQCGSATEPGDRFCGTCGAPILVPPPQAEQVIRRTVAAAQGAGYVGRRSTRMWINAVMFSLIGLLGVGAVAAFAFSDGLGLLGASDRPPADNRGIVPPQPETAQEPTAPDPALSAPPTSGEEVLEEFGREYDEASRSEDWGATYSMLDEFSQRGITEAEWTEAQRIVREAEGPPAPLQSVSVEQNEEMSDSPATLTLTYEDGNTETMMAMIPMVVEDESDSGVPKRVLFAQEIGELRIVASSGQSIEGIEAEVEEAAGDYYRAAGVEDWAYTYENLDEETQSGFTEEEWFQKNQWFADNGEVIYNIESVRRTGTSSEYWGVTLRLTYEDGSSSTRETYFVYEDGEWKHRFGEEENDLFMPDATFGEFVEAQGGGSSASPEGQEGVPPFPEDTNGNGGEEM